MQIKSPNWFAAGPEVQRGLRALSDGAFRVYVYLCLRADRQIGVVSMTYAELAEELARSKRAIVNYIEELRREGVCSIAPATNQFSKSRFQISDDFWPYVRVGGSRGESAEATYLDSINSFLAGRPCVKCSCSEPDRQLALRLRSRGISLEQVLNGIALGCCRKYVSLLNGSNSGPIRSLSYFEDVIAEAGSDSTPAGYWGYLRPELNRLEAQWKLARTAGNAKYSSPKTRQETR